MRTSSRSWYQNSEHLSLFDIHFILSYITVDSKDHLLPSVIPAVCLKSLSWTFSWITAAHHGHQSANYFKEIICTLRQFVTCKNMCGGKYMFLKGRTPKMFLDESVKMSKHRWHDTDHEKVNLKLPWKKKIILESCDTLFKRRIRGREVLLRSHKIALTWRVPQRCVFIPGHYLS